MADRRPPVRILGNAKPSLSRSGMKEYVRMGTQADLRTYEIYQRERVHEATEKIRPIELVSPEFVRDPYPVFETLRETIGSCSADTTGTQSPRKPDDRRWQRWQTCSGRSWRNGNQTPAKI
jgi:hypothetical protein